MPLYRLDTNRREFLKSVGIGAAVSLAGSAAAFSRETPNILLILGDDVGYECLSCDGSLSYQTPALDALAASGARFEQCHAQPLCTPSRVQLMTGQYNFRNYTGFGVLDPSQKTIAHVLKKQGYRTCVAGKWQLWGASDLRGKYGKGVYPEQAGFDEYCLWAVRDIGSRYADPFFCVNAHEPRLFPGEYGPDICCQFICDFIERSGQTPFFAYYSMMLTHAPFQPTPDSPEWQGPDRKKTDKKFFPDMVSYMDKLVGQVIGQLEKLGLREKTLVIFVGDNGTDVTISSQVHGGTIQGGKGGTTDAGTHVPLIANWPGTVSAGRVLPDLVDTTDFLPTILEATGAKPLPGMLLDGRSFLPQLEGRPGHPRQWVFFHYDPDWGKAVKARFVRGRRWKLYEDGRLYDLRADPLEQHVISDPSLEAREARQQLQHVLDTLK